MIKNIFFIYFLLLNTTCLHASSSDSINLSSTINPACEVSMDPEPVASNLDLTTSQTNLKIVRVNLANNTQGDPASPYSTIYNVDFSDHLEHQLNSIYKFYFSDLEMTSSIAGVGSFPFPFGANGGPSGATSEWSDFAISYTGIPALALVNGTYSTQWFVSCSIEPK